MAKRAGRVVDGTGGLSADQVLKAAEDFRRPWVILGTPPFLFLWVLMFWGGQNKDTAIWFSIGTVGAAIWFTAQGWEPWHMRGYELLAGRPAAPQGQSSIQIITTQFFKSARCARLQATWSGMGALIPWILFLVGRVVGGRPFRFYDLPVPWWGMSILGIGEGIRGRGLALYVLAGRLRQEWPALLEEAAALEEK